MTLTERDKKLLVFLGIFIVVVGIGWLVIRPMVQNLGALDEEIALAEVEQMEREDKLGQLPLLVAQNEALNQQYEDESKVYYPLMQSQQIDELLTLRALAHNLEARQLNIKMPQSMDDVLLLEPYYASAAALAVDPQDAKTEFHGLFAAEVTMELGGTRENLQAFLEEKLKETPKLRITSFSWKDGAGKVEGGWQLSLSLEIYMFYEEVDLLTMLMEKGGLN